MTSEQIRIERIKVKDIYQFACRIVDRTKQDEVLPITKHLALALAKNPYADEDDPALVVAYVGDRCAGYIGLFPGLLRTGDRYSKVFWGCTLFVAPEFRPIGIGGFLIKNLLSMKIDFVGAWGSEMAENIWRRLGLLGHLGPRDVYVLETKKLLMLSIDEKLLWFLHNFLGDLKYLSGFIHRMIEMIKRVKEQIIYPALKRVYYRLLLVRYGRHLKKIYFEEIDEIPKDVLDRRQYRPVAEFHRGVEWINWKLRYRMMLNYDEVDVSYANYHFGGLRDLFKYIALNVYSYDRKEYKGFLVLSICIHKSKTKIKILDFHFHELSDTQYIFLLSLRYAEMYKADYIILPNQLAHHFIEKKMTRIILGLRQHYYVIRPQNEESPLAKSLNEIELSLCDGDYSLT